MAVETILTRYPIPQISGIGRLVFMILFCSVILWSAPTAHTAQVTFAWDPNPEPDIAGYKMYYGTTSRDYDWYIDVGRVTTFTVPDLSDGVTYYFAVIAYDTSNLESAYSDEVRWSENAPPSPSPSGTIGTQITITDYSFGSKKGKVLVGNATTRIIDWTDSSTTFEVRKTLTPGSYDLVVQPEEPKGTAPIIYPGTFTMMAPKIVSIDPDSGISEDTVVLSGNFFGSKKGKVYLGAHKCKVLTWAMDAVTGTSQLRFVVPKKMSPGTYDITVTNRVGSFTLPNGFTI
jgi:hypothetical protein